MVAVPVSDEDPIRILVLTDTFVPEISALSFRTLEHARVWLARGHEVTVVTCAPNWPRGKLFEGYRNKLHQVEWIEGVRVIRLWTYMAANRGVIKRTLDYMSFTFSAAAQCWRIPDFDVILASSPTFFTAVAGFLISILRRRAWVFEIRDLWPASIRAVRASQSRVLDMVEKLELYLYRKADRIISVTHSIKMNLVSRGIEAGKIDVVPNAVDTGKFHPSRATFNARTVLGVPRNAFLAGYVGTTGMAHGLETILDAAERCKELPDIHFLIMGDGAERDALEESARLRRLGNLTFKDVVPHDQIPSYYAALDLSIVHLRPDPVFKTVIPSKIFEVMAMGVPILMAVEGESAEIIRESGSGVCIPSGDAEAMAQSVIGLSKDRAALEAMGRRGIAAAGERYSRDRMAEAALTCLKAAVEA